MREEAESDDDWSRHEWEGTAEKKDRGVVKAAGGWSGPQGVGQDCRGIGLQGDG